MSMKTFSKIVIAVTGAFAFVFPFSAGAISTGVNYGGFVSTVIPCTCSGGFVMTFSPFFNNSPVPTVGSLYFQAGLSIPFAYFAPGVPTTYELGKYTPGVPDACLIGIPPLCAPITIPVLGLVQYTGTSKPAGLGFLGL